MKTITATLLGLCVVLAVISSSQAHHHHHHHHKGGMMNKCKKHMHEHTEEDKEIFKKCKAALSEGASEGEGGEEMKAKMTKMGKCIVEEQKIVENNKFNLDNYNSLIDKHFKDAEIAALIKKEGGACGDASKDYKTDEDFQPLLKCMWKAMASACKGSEEAQA